jgi:death-on-curing protein
MTQSFISNNNERVFYLDCQSIIELHEILSNNVHLLEEMDPVEPRGVKNFGMLDSAVSRQTTGSGNYYKYPDASSNAATLVYGIIKNHAFHNGNKRAGLLALIKHLYVNGNVISPALDSKELYEILVAIADSKIPEFYSKHVKKYRFIRTKKERKTNDWDLETQLRFLAFWIKRNSKPKELTNKGEIKISTLKKVLDNKNIQMNQNGSNLEVYIEKENKFLGFLSLGTKKIMKKNYSLGNSRSTIGKTTLNVLRNDFKLTKKNGIDDTFFYDEDAFLDSEIKTYKKIIYQLSKT